MNGTGSEIAVVGAGIVGLASAVALQEVGHRVTVLEAERRVGRHQTGHNSGVVHSGLYYRPGSAKALLCVRGRRLLEELCLEEGLPYERCGKLVVATSPAEIPRLDELERRGRENGLEGLERLDPAGIETHEPAVRGVAGVWVPETGVADFEQVAGHLARRVVDGGGRLLTGRRVEALEPSGGGVRVRTAGAPIEARFAVVCAGLHADRLARRSGMSPGVSIVPFRGEYRELRADRRHLVRGLVYPVPDPAFPFLGVHLTRTVTGLVEAGPNAVLALAREGYHRRDIDPRHLLRLLTDRGFLRLGLRHWRFGVAEMYRSFSRRAFLASARRLVPTLEPGDLQPGGSGVRAQAVDRRGRLLDDFHFAEGPGMLHVLNAPSPAATASLAIGEEIARRVGERLGV